MNGSETSSYPNYFQRVYTARNIVEKLSHDYFYVTNLATIRWITGFAGSTSSLLIGAKGIYLFVDPRYEEDAYSLESVERGHVTVVVSEISQDERSSIAQKVSGKTVVCESLHITAEKYVAIQAVCAKSGASATLQKEDSFASLRGKKDPYEYEATCRSVAIAEKAFQRVCQRSFPLTEKSFQQQLDAEMILLGADKPAFDTIVASGENTVKPHAKPSTKEIKEGEFLLVDWGAEVDGYRSDTSRTIWWGDITAEQKNLYAAVLETLEVATSCIKVGVSYGDVMSAARNNLKRHKLDSYIRHPFGHNVGLEIHERPFFSDGEKEKIRSGSIVALEPAVYVPGLGGVRLENLLYVGDKETVTLNNLPFQEI